MNQKGDVSWMMNEQMFQLVRLLPREGEDRQRLESKNSTPSMLQLPLNTNSTNFASMMGNRTMPSSVVLLTDPSRQRVKSGLCPCLKKIDECPLCSKLPHTVCIHGTRTYCRECRMYSGRVIRSYVDTVTTGLVKKECLVKKDSCEHCGSTKNLHLHHWSYIPPLEVETLCRKCHRFAHSNPWKPIKYPSGSMMLVYEFIVLRKPIKRIFRSKYHEYYSMIGDFFFKNPKATWSWLNARKYSCDIHTHCYVRTSNIGVSTGTATNNFRGN